MCLVFTQSHSGVQQVSRKILIQMTSPSEAFNKDELEAPQWMNADFFTQVLQRDAGDSARITVTGYKMTPATAKGDHYASIMFRAAVDYRTDGVAQHKTMIIKTMPDVEGMKSDMLKESHIFQTEIGMYTKVLPRFEQMLRDVGDATVLGARCLYHSLTPKQVIIFEDLLPLGYAVMRATKPGVEEIKVAYMKLAKLHACSYKLIAEEPEFFEQYRHGIFTLNAMIDQAFFTDGIKVFNEMLAKMPEYSEYRPYFASLQDDLLKSCVAKCVEYHENPQPGALYVLTHGDFHYKNMMFKHGVNAKLQDVMLLDYQMCMVGSIAWDLIYSIIMLLSTEQRTEHLDALLVFYFENFVATLKKIGYKGAMPDFAELKREMRRLRHFEMFLLVTFLPMWYAWNEKVDPDLLLSSAEYRHVLYSGEEFLADLKLLLPKYKKLGYFDKN